MSKQVLASARRRLESLEGQSLSTGQVLEATEGLAAELFQLSRERALRSEKARERRLSAMLDDDRGQLLGILLTDRVARDRSLSHAADQLRHLKGLLGSPAFASPLERLQLEMAVVVGRVAPRLVGRLIAAQIRGEVEGLIFPFEPRALARYLQSRRDQGIEVNLNYLGEEVLGEEHAERRVRQYVELLGRPEVGTISVKLSSIFSQIDLCAWDETVRTLSDRLRPIYRAALDAGRGGRPRLVYLDMEAHADLRLTLDVMRRLLDEPELSGLSAGVVLQAYVPESAALQRELSEWAIARVERGGAPLRLRLVKGANLAAERVHAEQAGWKLPLFASKPDVDASYAKMLSYGTRPEVARAIRLGVASHNVFDLALGLVLRATHRLGDSVGFEVLEGMANPVQRVLRDLGAPVLVYTPVVNPDELESAVAYLVRRLDENTAEENFLRHAFSMQLHDERYEAQRRAFTDAYARQDAVSETPRRAANRYERVADLAAGAPFSNEADTDFSSADNRDCLDAALEEMRGRPCVEVHSCIGGQVVSSPRLVDAFDPSRPGAVPYRVGLASREQVASAVRAGSEALPAFRRIPVRERIECVRRVAGVLRRRRAELTAAMLMDTAKRASEGDVEVSEAIDFAEYYCRQFERSGDGGVAEAAPLGVVTVASPWNFPLAIPLSGILAALLAGNVVAFKPALESAFVGALVADCVWQAGIPKSAMQLVLCDDEQAAPLIESPDVRGVVLTGATSTAEAFLERRPDLRLFAETGGKNALIISALADRDRAIGDLIASAFGHSGQKCSAASLAIVDAEVYDDPQFQKTLASAASSLVVGSAWRASSRVTPLIREPGNALRRGLSDLDEGESWLLEPRQDPDNPRLWSPGVRWNVAQGSFCHQTELFGPVLSVLRARDLEHALSIANSTRYGLVAGLHSLDEREQERFVRTMNAGNLYVNRTITGAIVGRQPFGGRKASSVGPGAKAGGPNYVAQLQEPTPVAASPSEPEGSSPRHASLRRLIAASGSALVGSSLERLRGGVLGYEREHELHFDKPSDPIRLPGQDNVFRYQPCERVLVVALSDTDPCDALLTCAAGLLAGVALQVVVDRAAEDGRLRGLETIGEAAGFPVSWHSPDRLPERLVLIAPERVRWLGDRVPEAVLRAAHALGAHVAGGAAAWRGRAELLCYHREQAISVDYHRHGHMGLRAPGIDHSPGFTTSSKATFSPMGPAGRGP